MNPNLYSVVPMAIGMIFLILLAVYLRLYDFRGAPIQKRNAYSIVAATFFLATFSLGIGLDKFANLETLVLTGVLFPGLAAISIWWIKGKLRGHEVFRKTKSIRMQSVSIFLFVFLLIFSLMQAQFRSSFEAPAWIIAGLLLSFFLGTIFNFLYVMKLERKLGQKIVERKEV